MNNKTRIIGRLPVLAATLVLSSAVCLLSGFFPAWATHSRADEYAATNTREGRIAVFDDVWETINERYYDPTFKGLDWNASRPAFRRAAADARSSEELYDILRRMIETLNDPHTRVYSPERKSDWWNPRFVSVGLSVREIEGIPTVVQVEPESAPAHAGIKPGDQIESIDQLPVEQLIHRRLQRPSRLQANNNVRYRIVAGLLDGEPGSLAQLVWRGRNGQVKTASFPRYLSQRELGFKISRRDKYLVVEIQTFTRELTFALLRELRDKLPGAGGVILDLRSNGGGDAHAMASIASLFLGVGVELGRFTDRVGSSFQLTTRGESIVLSRMTVQADLPIVALISESTSSAAEILASSLQHQRRARLIGTGTCGCVLAIRSRHTLPDGGVLDVSEFDYKTADGTRLEGRGIQPDMFIAPLRRDLYSRRDRTLQTAIIELKETLNPVVSLR